MRNLLALFLALTLLSGCGEKPNDKPAQNNSNDAAKRVLDQLGDGSNNKHIKKDGN